MSCSSTASISSLSKAQDAGIPFDAHAGASPCTSCGACCAHFRVSFHWSEGNDVPNGWVPVHLTRDITQHLRAMAGTEIKPVRCEALVGELGQHVGCSIYQQRPSTCREFNYRDAAGRVDERCTQARQAFGLPPVG